MDSPPGQTCARRSDRPLSDNISARSNPRTLSISCSTTPSVRPSSVISSWRATASVARIVPEVPIASTSVASRKKALTGRNSNCAAMRALLNPARVISPHEKNRSVIDTQPMCRLSSARGSGPCPRISSVLPPPISMTNLSPSVGGRLCVTPLYIRRASSIPEIISIGCPSAASASAMNVVSSRARRMVLVPAARTLSAWMSLRRSPNRDKQSRARARASGEISPLSESPSASLTVSRMRSSIASCPWRNSPTIM